MTGFVTFFLGIGNFFRKNWQTILLVIMPLIVLGLVIWAIYSAGYSLGKAEVNALWTKDRLQREEAYNALLEEMGDTQLKHAMEMGKIQNELILAKHDYENALVAIRNTYVVRLSRSEQRAAIYQRQAEGSASDRGDLASHAARLDRTLEQGRQLVEEFRATVGQRDRQLRALGQQIANDRRFLEVDYSLVPEDNAENYPIRIDMSDTEGADQNG